VALVTGTNEPETELELVELRVMVWVTKAVLVEFDGPIGEPSVDEVESVPLLGRSLKLTVALVEEVTAPVPLKVLALLENEAEGDEVEFEEAMGDPEVADSEGEGAPQLTVPYPPPGGP
jgi:hypothetical protein